MIGFYNEIIPPSLYKEQMTAVDLQRSVLNCSSCPLVTCKSKRLDSSIQKKNIFVILDKFSDKSADSYEMQYLQSIFNWLQIDMDDIYITSSMKCEHGVAENCASHIVSEIVHFEPTLILHLGEQSPKFTLNPLSPGDYELVHKSLLLHTYAPQQWQDPSVYQQACQHMWQAVQQLRKQEMSYA